MKPISCQRLNDDLVEKKTFRIKLFADLFGVWSKEDKTEFDKHTQEFERIDPSDW